MVIVFSKRWLNYFSNVSISIQLNETYNINININRSNCLLLLDNNQQAMDFYAFLYFINVTREMKTRQKCYIIIYILYKILTG